MTQNGARSASPIHGDFSAVGWLTQLPDGFLACRGQGHAWPKIRPAKTARGLQFRPQSDGCYEIVQRCRDCGMERRMITLPGGVLDANAIYTYAAPEGYASPPGSEITRRDCLAETLRRMAEETRAASANGSKNVTAAAFSHA